MEDPMGTGHQAWVLLCLEVCPQENRLGPPATQQWLVISPNSLAVVGLSEFMNVITESNI